MMKSGTFSKRSGAATKGFESCELVSGGIFQFKYSFVFSGIVCTYGRKKSQNFVGTVYLFGV